MKKERNNASVFKNEYLSSMSLMSVYLNQQIYNFYNQPSEIQTKNSMIMSSLSNKNKELNKNQGNFKKNIYLNRY